LVRLVTSTYGSNATDSIEMEIVSPALPPSVYATTGCGRTGLSCVERQRPLNGVGNLGR